MPEANSAAILSNPPSRYPRIAPEPAQKPRLLDSLREALHSRHYSLYTLPIHEQKMGVKLGDTFWGMCNLIKPLDWSQNSAAILQAASRADFPN